MASSRSLFACVYPMHVAVWTQQQGVHGEGVAWLRTAVIRLPIPAPNPLYQPLEKWFDFGRGSMLVLHRSCAVSVLDLDKKVVERIMDDCLLPEFSDVLDHTRSQLLLTILTRNCKVNLHSYSATIQLGAAHWLWINNDNNLLYKLSTEVGKHPCVLSLTKLPQLRVRGSPLLCVGRDGQLSVACAYPMHVTVWTQHGEDTAWLRTAVIRLPMPTLNQNPLHQPLEKWFDFDRGSMLVLHRGSTVSILDLDKKVVEKIMDDCLLPTFSHVLDQTRSVAYKMDLVKFFLLHLGGLCRIVAHVMQSKNKLLIYL
ncbi:hypothetical protein ACQ4PT_036020 [Festuca glaucescens]